MELHIKASSLRAGPLPQLVFEVVVAAAQNLQSNTRILRPKPQYCLQDGMDTFIPRDVANEQNRGLISRTPGLRARPENLGVYPAVNNIDRWSRHPVEARREIGRSGAA